jgi:protein-tyrosine phosphatase
MTQLPVPVYVVAALGMILPLSVGVIRSRLGDSSAKVDAIDLPQHARLIVFVCDNSTSRSAMASQMCTALLARLRILRPPHLADSIYAVSRGISAIDGKEMDPLAITAIQWLGFVPAPHAASQLTRTIMDRAYLVFCMTDAQVMQVQRCFPSSPEKVLRLHKEIDIPNPVGMGRIDFEYVAALLHKAIHDRIKLITTA